MPARILLLIFLLSPALALAETAEEALARYDAVSVKTEGDFLPTLFTGIGRDIAYTHRLALIPLILKKSSTWKGEEGLLYLPIILNLPLEETIASLQHYARDPHAREALWAREFLIEIESWLAENLKKTSAVLEETDGKANGKK